MFSFIKSILYGIAIGILIAPDKGTETRKKIVKFFTDAKDDAKAVINKSAEDIKAETAG